MVKQVEVNGEAVIIGGNGALVASKSQPGNWHIVKAGVCDCLGYQHRGRCRHVVAVAALDASHDEAGQAAYVVEWERQEHADVVFALRYAR